jgi:hypothetical protein
LKRRKDPAAVARGKAGFKSRAAGLTKKELKKELSESGRHAVAARWKKVRASGRKDPIAVEVGRNLDHEKGAMARAQSLTAEERSEIARKAARARWGK